MGNSGTHVFSVITDYRIFKYTKRTLYNTKLATDIFHFEGASYLLIVDYKSRFPVVHMLSSMTGQHIANQCKLISSEYGWPETLISDNVPCCTPEAFTRVMKAYDVNHITSSALSAI